MLLQAVNFTGYRLILSNIHVVLQRVSLFSGNRFFMSGDITLGRRKATLKNVELGALMYNTLHKCAQEPS